MPQITVRSLSAAYGEQKVLTGLELTVADGELFVLLGPSGAGKTSLINVICGLLRPKEGSVEIGGRLVSSPEFSLKPHLRGIAVVFQDGSLWPHMTALGHLLFVLEGKVPSAEARERAREALSLVKLEGMEARHPDELSGGERQRLALARALVSGSKVLLLDEPFSNLDRPLARALIEDVAALHRKLGLTTLLVTHYQEEALLLADRMGVIKDGRILQRGRPEEIYHSPRDLFVAGFFGDNNFLPARCDGAGNLLTPLGTLPFPRDEGDYVLCVRPTALIPSRESGGTPGRLVSSRFLGDWWMGRVRLEGGEEVIVNFGADPPAPGEWFLELAGPWTALPKP